MYCCLSASLPAPAPVGPPGRSNDPALEFLRSVASEVPCQKKGFFQFSAVAAGSYALVAQDGDALAQMSPVEVWEGSESRITIPILLRKPVDFEVAKLAANNPADFELRVRTLA